MQVLKFEVPSSEELRCILYKFKKKGPTPQELLDVFLFVYH